MTLKLEIITKYSQYKSKSVFTKTILLTLPVLARSLVETTPNINQFGAMLLCLLERHQAFWDITVFLWDMTSVVVMLMIETRWRCGLGPPVQLLGRHIRSRDDSSVWVYEPESYESSVAWSGGILELEGGYAVLAARLGGWELDVRYQSCI